MKEYEFINSGTGKINIVYYDINGNVEITEYYSKEDGTESTSIKEGYSLKGGLNWEQLAKDLNKSTVFNKLLNGVYPVNMVAYSTILKIIIDKSSESTFLFLFNKLGLTLTNDEILELNTIFENNYFTIRL